MSNLSELLPAGAGAKSAEFVASGTLGSGVTVALKADGTVEAVTLNSAGAGSAVAFESANTEWISSAYDANSNTVVIAYKDGGNSSYGTAIVGTVSGLTISFGAAVVFYSGNTSSTSCVFDSNNNKIVISYREVNTSISKSIVGTVSGSSISFGTSVTFLAEVATFISSVFDSLNNKVVIAYKSGATNFGTAIVGTVSGTSISFGSSVTFEAANLDFIAAVFDSNSNKVVIAYRDYGNSFQGTAIVGTVSGTSISFGTSVLFNTASVEYISLAFDSTNNKVIVAYQDEGNSSYGTSKIGTVSGTSISFGSATVFESAITFHTSTTFDSSNDKIVIAYQDQGNSNYGTAVIGTVSGTSISFGSSLLFNSASTGEIASSYDSVNAKTVIFYRDTSSSNYGTSVVFQTTASSNNTSFIGITDQAIADTATGAVIVQGGVSDKASAEYSFSFGGASVFESANAQYMSSAYDSNAERLVVAYGDLGNSTYGTVAVGTISGDSISYGTPVVFNNASTAAVSCVYDPVNFKVVIFFRDAGNSNYGTAIVGTVSGTSISFGAKVVFESDAIGFTLFSSYDVNAEKIVASYQDSGNLFYGTAIVGTVIGTSISFGLATVFNSGSTSAVSSSYDSTSNKTIIAYRDGDNSNYGTAIVGTVSGTSISFGAETVFNAASTTYISPVYDPVNNKTVIAYANDASPNTGDVIIGTVSGTSISFGTSFSFLTTSVNFVSTVYDAQNNQIVISYSDDVNLDYGAVVAASVNGTNLSFSSSFYFEEAKSDYISASYSASLGKTIISYQDDGNSSFGTSIVADLSNLLTPNTNYYVQSDGTISTTVSSVPAGRALSSTSILLEG